MNSYIIHYTRNGLPYTKIVEAWGEYKAAYIFYSLPEIDLHSCNITKMEIK